jgi:6-phosphogluconolactonase
MKMVSKSYFPDYDVFATAEELASVFAGVLISEINSLASNSTPVNIALSGGSTPLALFRIISEKYPGSVNWRVVHFFWVDERCVPPDDSESNYGNAKKMFNALRDLPATNVHRIMGEMDPVKEAVRYADEIRRTVRYKNDWPRFDIVLLGMGDDGHTASIFPPDLSLFNSNKICEPARHPVSGQVRITLTGRVLNNATSIYILVAGRKKAQVIGKVFNRLNEPPVYPVSLIDPINGHLKWYLDSDAASLLQPDQSC